MKREIKFRAFWKDTGKPILDFTEEYIIDACNDDVFIVEQFTGLKDKNGVDIYEGDTFELKVGMQSYSGFSVGDPNATIRGSVQWNKNQLCWEIVCKYPNKYNIVSYSFGWGMAPHLEIIGNIHETPL